MATTHEPMGQLHDPAIEQFLQDEHKNSMHSRIAVGIGMIAAAGGLAFGIHEAGQADLRIAYALPFSEQVQQGVNQLDTVLEMSGYGLFAAAAGIGAVKLAASRKGGNWLAIDDLSSKEMANDGQSNSFGRRVLQAGVAGSIPLLATGGALAATFTSGIGTEVSEGPLRPLGPLDQLGSSMIVQYKQAQTMVTSSIRPDLEAQIMHQANARNVRATPIDFNLGVMEYQDGTSSTDLTMGVPVAPGSILDYKPVEGCKLIPISLDVAANKPIGEKVLLNGVPAEVVEHTTGLSATNRYGIKMDAEALKGCLKQEDPQTSGDHAVILDAPQQTANEILTAAKEKVTAPAAAITVADYKHNSKEFWDSNVKPLTNVLSLVSGLITVAAMSAASKSRLLRNRQQLATNMAKGLTDRQLRTTETLRNLKDAVAVGTIGPLAGSLVTSVVNVVEPGFHAGAGAKEVLVGMGVAMWGAVGGSLVNLMRPSKTVKPEVNTRQS
jgi:hypothetical protein